MSFIERKCWVLLTHQLCAFVMQHDELWIDKRVCHRAVQDAQDEHDPSLGQSVHKQDSWSRLLRARRSVAHQHSLTSAEASQSTLHALSRRTEGAFGRLGEKHNAFISRVRLYLQILTALVVLVFPEVITLSQKISASEVVSGQHKIRRQSGKCCFVVLFRENMTPLITKQTRTLCLLSRNQTSLFFHDILHVYSYSLSNVMGSMFLLGQRRLRPHRVGSPGSRSRFVCLKIDNKTSRTSFLFVSPICLIVMLMMITLFPTCYNPLSTLWQYGTEKVKQSMYI